MKHVIALSGAVLVLVLLGTMPAMAGPFTLLNNGSSITLSYLTPDALVSGSATFSLSSGNQLTIVLNNTSGTAAGVGVITGIAWDNTPDLGINLGGSLPSPWAFGVGGLGGHDQSIGVSGIGSGLNPGQSQTFVLNLSASHTSIDFENTLLHIQNIPALNGSSFKPEGNPGGTPVPEPASTALLIGISCLGLGFARKLWRK